MRERLQKGGDRVKRRAFLQAVVALSGGSVVQLTKFELVLNAATAKKLGLAVSRDFLARVDEVIE